MLPKENRLRKKDFNEVYSNGKNVSSDIGYFKILKKDGNTMFSCVASKKDTAKSVDRTRIRRRGYAAVEKHLNSIPSGYRIIWFLPQKSLSIPIDNLVKEVEKMITSLDDV